MKSFAKFCLVFVTALSLCALACHAQSSNAPASTNAVPHARPPRPRPVSGTIASSDSAAKTITLTLANGETQVIHTTSKTRYRKDGQHATFADAATGEKVRITARKNEAGDLEAITVNIGNPKPKPAAPPQ